MKMKTIKKITVMPLIIATIIFSVTGCTQSPSEVTATQTDQEVTKSQTEQAVSQAENTVSQEASTEANSITTNAQGTYTDKDLDASWDVATSTQIELTGGSASINGAGASVTGSIITINGAGNYLIKGQLGDGQIIVEAGENDDVHLILNGISIYSETTSPIFVKRADKVIITLADGTENLLEDGSNYVFEDESIDEPNATLFSDADLTINGFGSLSVKSTYNNAIGSKDDLVIISGTFIIDAKNHALRGRDSITIQNGIFDLVAGSDALQANNDEDDSKGFVIIDGGTFEIASGDDAIHAETLLTITGGKLDILKSYEGLEASKILVSGGDISLWASDDGINAAGETGGNYEYRQTGGTVYVNAEGDGLDANGSFLLEGGTLTIDGPVMAMNGALDYDGTGIIKGGTLIAAGSSGMAQTPGSGSTQNALMIYFTETQVADTEVSLEDANGDTIAIHSPSKEFQTLLFSNDALVLNETYTLYSDGVELAKVTLSDAIMTVSDTGEIVTGGFGNFGGMRGGKIPATRP
jgi:hypothetical protein